MANYTASALSAAQVKYSKNFADAELRRKQNPALMLALKNVNPLVVDVQNLKKKDTMPVKAYLKKKRAAGAGVAKAYNHAGAKADSAEVTLAFITIVEPFSILLKQAQGNVFTYQDMLEHELMESAKNIHARAGTLAQAFLYANRTQTAAPATGGAGTWNAANFALEVSQADKDLFYQKASAFMRKQNYRGRFDVIAEQLLFSKAEYMKAQGAGNQTNLSFQLGACDIVETTEDIDPNYSNTGSALIMEQGQFAGLQWNDPVNLKGKGDYDSVLGGFGAVQDPLGSGMLFDFHAYTQRADGSALGGGVQDEILEAEVSLTISWVLSPLSTANESVVYEVAQSA